MLQLLSNFLNAIGAIFGFAAKRQDLQNAPDVRAAAIAQKEVTADDHAEVAVKNRDVQTVRQDLGE